MSVYTHTAHPVLGCAESIRTALAGVSQVEPMFMSVADKEAALVVLARAESQVAELRLRVLATADDVAVEHGSRDAGVWYANATQTDPRVAAGELRLAKALDSRPGVAAGVRSGAVSVAQARVITTALDELPAELGPQLQKDAEVSLVGYAKAHHPGELRRLGRRILEVVAPEITEEEEGKKLEAEERRAREKETLRFKDLGDGTTRIWGRLATSVCERLKAYLQAQTSPRKQAAEQAAASRDGCCVTSSTSDENHDHEHGGESAGTGERIPQHRAYARAFAALLENLGAKQLPEHGGDATTILITLSYEQLLRDLSAAAVITGDGYDRISATEARRLACQANLIPVVLGGKGDVLDLGRSQRLYSKAQRKALRLRDRRCRAEGCTIPAAWTEAHHLKPWSRGGRTDLEDGVSLCSHHHHRAHDTTYLTQRLPNGDLRFARRT